MVARRPAGPGRPRLRLTRRGRIVVQLFVILLASGVAALVASASRASDPVVGPAPSVVVEPHDTLWSIASRHAPDRDTRSVVAEIRLLNGLPDYTVHAGRRLALPR
jgi:LysM domain